jgi:diguanylate cyclase (GGDEF)-like protein
VENFSRESSNAPTHPPPAAALAATPVAIQRQLDSLLAVFDTVDDAILVLDGRGIVVMANAVAERLLGPLPTLLDVSISKLLMTGDSLEEATPLLDADALPLIIQQKRWAVSDVVLMTKARPAFAADFALVPFNTGGQRSAVVTITDKAASAPDWLALEWQATHDPLTGLSNRTILVDRLNHALLLAARTGMWPTLMYLDLDRFKSANDQLGRPTADRLLVDAAARIKRSVRAADTVARLGGDEFVVLCEALERPDVVQQVAARILNALDMPFDFSGETVLVSASIGIVSADATNNVGETILQNAELAMYRAKENGRNRSEVFDPVIRADVRRRIDLERALREALDNGEIAVMYQPIFDTHEGALIAFEALARWHDPVFGQIGPKEFISLAEETGLIAAVGERVLDISCRDAASWREAAQFPVGLHVNVSGRQVSASNFVNYLARVLRHHHVDPSSLTLELQESVLLDNPERAAARLMALRELGVRIAIDDFGVGYSSLAYLRRFPLDTLKVDRQFVSGIAQSSQGREILQEIIDLAAGNEYSVIAEGVEQPEELVSLRELGFQYAQGYLLAAPMPPAEALLLAAASSIPVSMRTDTEWADSGR